MHEPNHLNLSGLDIIRFNFDVLTSVQMYWNRNLVIISSIQEVHKSWFYIQSNAMSKFMLWFSDILNILLGSFDHFFIVLTQILGTECRQNFITRKLLVRVDYWTAWSESELPNRSGHEWTVDFKRKDRVISSTNPNSKPAKVANDNIWIINWAFSHLVAPFA